VALTAHYPGFLAQIAPILCLSLPICFPTRREVIFTAYRPDCLRGKGVGMLADVMAALVPPLRSTPPATPVPLLILPRMTSPLAMIPAAA
jgi:hypothetical protein